VFPIVDAWGLDLYVSRGFSSVSYLQSAADAITASGKPTNVYIFTDLDPSGMSIADKIGAELKARVEKTPVAVERLAVTLEQVDRWDLPTRPVKLTDTRTARFIREYGDRCCELDAIAPHELRRLVDEAIEQWVDRRGSTEPADRGRGAADVARHRSEIARPPRSTSHAGA
jgi:hypothetical protein